MWESATNVVASPKLGLKYRLADGWSLVGTSARGFRSPVGIIGDPSREPYLAWSHELGIEHEGAIWDAKLTAFRVDVDNERVFDPITLTEQELADIAWELCRVVQKASGVEEADNNTIEILNVTRGGLMHRSPSS